MWQQTTSFPFQHCYFTRTKEFFIYWYHPTFHFVDFRSLTFACWNIARQKQASLFAHSLISSAYVPSPTLVSPPYSSLKSGQDEDAAIGAFLDRRTSCHSFFSRAIWSFASLVLIPNHVHVVESSKPLPILLESRSWFVNRCDWGWHTLWNWHQVMSGSEYRAVMFFWRLHYYRRWLQYISG